MDRTISGRERAGGRVALIRVLALTPLVVGMLFLSGCRAGPPDDMGPRNGTLAPCPARPYCVQTGFRQPDGTRGMYLKGSVMRRDLMPGIIAVVTATPGTTIIEQDDNYLRAEVSSGILRSVDDLELMISLELELIVRSSSRGGRGDGGRNQALVEDLRVRLIEAGLVR